MIDFCLGLEDKEFRLNYTRLVNAHYKKMKIGLVMAVYNGIDYLEKCLAPWIEYRNKYPNTLFISCVDGRFKDFGGETQNSNDGTVQYLISQLNFNKIDYFQALLKDNSEHDARNYALSPLLINRCDYVISWGVDEIATLEQIEKIVSFIEKNEFIDVFRIKYRNFVFDKKTYTLGFSPKRVWKVNDNSLKLLEYRWDDDAAYKNLNTDAIILDDNLPTITIPSVEIDHFTWLDDERSKKKVEYQERHFGKNGCSFSWNYENNRLFFNREYFLKNNLTIPILYEKML